MVMRNTVLLFCPNKRNALENTLGSKESTSVLELEELDLPEGPEDLKTKRGKKKKKKKKEGKVPEWLQDGVGVSGDNDGNDSGYADDAKHCRNRQNQFEFKAAACL